MPADISSIAYFTPILVFLIVFVIMFALLARTKILGESKFIQLFISFLISTIFVTAGSVNQIVLNVVPWFVVLIVALFFILALAGFIGKSDELVGKGLGWFFVGLLILIFLISGIKVFSATIGPYLPGSDLPGGDQDILRITDWIYSPRVAGAALLLAVTAVVSWILVKTK
ncbi:hypothetical protein CXT76_00850 [Candidatus Parvarchaeota archaeon]|jgi:hypothetical protein|nr:MAG: hypothetical protein CXX78_01160 [Candidatus Parvarchaeota archaeon]PXY71621.1 MAG: hypothetical protein CXX78_00025 [Candidatus Parvarchaeota archaeon]RZD31190.1 MAG: hypothetical protein CXT76_00850 [Candidatus Parvarchaeota archaeon]HIG52212.1 hypothetical protein [Candidatus Pacearchaeota archaeon]